MKKRSLLPAALLCLLLIACGPSGPADKPDAAAAAENGEIVFSCGASFPADAEEVTAVLNEGETALLDEFSALKRVDASGSVCYAELAAYRAAHPEIEVRYTVDLGTPVDVNATEAALTGPTAAERIVEHIAYLPELKALDVRAASFTAEEIAAIRAAAPDVELGFLLSVGGIPIDSDATALDLSGLPLSALDEACEALSLLTKLETVNLNHVDGAVLPDGAAAAQPAEQTTEGTAATGLGWTGLGRLQAACPGARFDYRFTYMGKTFSVCDPVVSLSGLKLGNKRADEVQAFGAYLQCDMLEMEHCGISNERMAALRDALPNTKVVWRVSFGPASARTDAVRIRLVKDYYKFSKSDLQTLKYCVDCELLDLGHNGLRNIDFAAHMPKLRVAILAIGYVDDISPLAGCTEMEYLELFTNRIADITPLTGMTKLKHLNLTWNRVEDVSPLFSMTGLERLWIGRNLFSEEQQAQLAAALPDTEIKYSHGPTGEGWRVHPRYDRLREEFNYDHPKTGGY